MLSGAAFTLKHSGSGQVLLKDKPWVNTSTAAETAAQGACDGPKEPQGHWTRNFNLTPEAVPSGVTVHSPNVFSLFF